MNPKSLLLPAAAILGLSSSVLAGTATIDATSGASISVTKATCTSTGFSATWSFDQGGGTWRFYYGTTNVAAPTVTGWATTVNLTSKSVTVSNLTPNTKYYAIIAGWENTPTTRAQGYAHLSFTTDATAAVIARPEFAPVTFQGYDAFGRRLGRIPAVNGVEFSDQGSQVRIPR
jgi:hypothetical protein